MRLVLASGSASRLMLLHNAGVEPIVHPADVDEETILARLETAPPRERVAALAQAKCETVAPVYPADVTVGCDSMLLIDGQLTGKPHTQAEAIRRWENQSGKVGTLLTAHYITGPQCDGSPSRKTFADVSETRVYFASPTRRDIEAYAASGEPLPCAGAFTLEALGSWFIDRIEGDPSGVIGLSIPTLRRALYSLGIDASSLWNR
ncbi:MULTISPECIES: nucleoside triphosphate pyrophosphatase [Corynebacterium]|nr:MULTISPECIES: nucleoside triphosphate pyrophosphatase [Corynebacterium]MCT1441894.1 Maf-like protein [Corynebacterium glucuronolyticum]MCT1563600.1 Maf-like protein [Corynebacterium glucuronolyticum]OFO47840.1 septum formation inhibitor Maf [Corynebacterium sp. HMSC073D01]QQB46333.1 septum formation inhibitor Maf [Corynebacterium glucuronolyticum]QRO81614.1 septum formation inhibitor Maf [Corynebacterium glucuronolyticum]